METALSIANERARLRAQAAMSLERGNNVIVYQISLPDKQDVEAFVTFMREEYFPAVHKGATRVGQVTNLVLLQAEPEGATKGCELFWHVGWDGLAIGGARVDDEAVIRRFESFKARIKRIGSYTQVAAWSKNGAV